MKEALWVAFGLLVFFILFGGDLIQTAYDLATWASGAEQRVTKESSDPWRDAAGETGEDENLRRWYERGADPNAYPYDH